MTTYVKAWAFFLAIIVMCMSITATALLYGQSQNTQEMLKNLTNDFETKMVDITTNNSVLMASVMATFQQQLANSTIQIETLATQNGALEQQVTTLTGQITTLQGLYDALLISHQTISDRLSVEENLSDAYHLHDLNLENITSFIEEDITDEHPYIVDEYTAINYVSDVSKNASILGIRCGMLVVYGNDGVDEYVLYLNVFNTTDEDLVFVDTDDALYDSISAIGDDYALTITRYVIIW